MSGETVQQPEPLVERSKAVTPAEIQLLRGEEASPEPPEVWQDQIDRSLLTVTARDPISHELIGIGFVVGSMRHAELVDLNVREEARQQGVGARIGKELVDFVQENRIRYVGLTFDETKPWLKDWYATAGFKQVDFAMWLERSINSSRD